MCGEKKFSISPNLTLKKSGENCDEKTFDRFVGVGDVVLGE